VGKLKIYLDTSVISHLKHDDTPDKMRDTLKLWDDIKNGKYEVFISETTFEEIYECHQPKRDLMLRYLSEIEVKEIKISGDIEELAQIVIDAGILKQKSFDDCLHIASAVLNGCNYIVSWNFKHMVNVNTNRGIRLIAFNRGFKDIELVTPTMLVESEG